MATTSSIITTTTYPRLSLPACDQEFRNGWATAPESASDQIGEHYLGQFRRDWVREIGQRDRAKAKKRVASKKSHHGRDHIKKSWSAERAVAERSAAKSEAKRVRADKKHNESLAKRFDRIIAFTGPVMASEAAAHNQEEHAINGNVKPGQNQGRKQRDVTIVTYRRGMPTTSKSLCRAANKKALREAAHLEEAEKTAAYADPPSSSETSGSDADTEGPAEVIIDMEFDSNGLPLNPQEIPLPPQGCPDGNGAMFPPYDPWNDPIGKYQKLNWYEKLEDPAVAPPPAPPSPLDGYHPTEEQINKMLQKTYPKKEYFISALSHLRVPKCLARVTGLVYTIEYHPLEDVRLLTHRAISKDPAPYPVVIGRCVFEYAAADLTTMEEWLQWIKGECRMDSRCVVFVPQLISTSCGEIPLNSTLEMVKINARPRILRVCTLNLPSTIAAQAIAGTEFMLWAQAPGLEQLNCAGPYSAGVHIRLKCTPLGIGLPRPGYRPPRLARFPTLLTIMLTIAVVLSTIADFHLVLHLVMHLSVAIAAIPTLFIARTASVLVAIYLLPTLLGWNASDISSRYGAGTILNLSWSQRLMTGLLRRLTQRPASLNSSGSLRDTMVSWLRSGSRVTLMAFLSLSPTMNLRNFEASIVDVTPSRLFLAPISRPQKRNSTKIPGSSSTSPCPSAPSASTSSTDTSERTSHASRAEHAQNTSEEPPKTKGKERVTQESSYTSTSSDESQNDAEQFALMMTSSESEMTDGGSTSTTTSRTRATSQSDSDVGTT